ncbi:phosphopantothenate/pantothenate synthetase [Thermococcus argininiproducens]|uniref:4-phosphopantoate--beta-alanine ligase n=1 Tax=Thermococcus argininiproducens TaxID=2866384 RepID=A0A9E7SBP2_9EURY|nr:4-phosphopantoate--beta-alanine ligase [Thermococcus argininiproducens]USG99079.1 phosphopantothenate/pantothenate synthetase [Thermococcus argininiproducens]
MVKIPKSHPRYWSLYYREKIIEGMEKGMTAKAGLIAHGRGEAFDYLIGETTIEPAEKALKAAVAKLLLAEYPVISVNGNVAALVPKETIELAKALNAKLEINLFYRTEDRVKTIAEELRKHDPNVELLGINPTKRIPNLESERGKVDENGIWKADVVVVPLEDGDRTEALVAMGKFIITIDLNPLSRSARMADITIVDNIVRAYPRMIELAKEMKKLPKEELEKIVKEYNNGQILNEVLLHINSRLEKLSKEGVWRKKELST